MDYDVVVIGAGSAGMSAYRAAKKAEKKTLLIENNLYGTKCARYGCMPSKLLIAAAESMHEVQKASQFGIKVDEPKVDPFAVMRRVRRERERFVNFVVDDVHDFPEEDKKGGIYSFVDNNTICMKDREEKITSKTFVIATGSTPKYLPIFKSEWIGDLVLDTEQFFNFHVLPKSIAVIGSGVIGMELGQALTRLGVRTTIIGVREHISGLTDPLVLERANRIFENEVKIYNRAEITEVDFVHEEYEKSGLAITWYQDGIQYNEEFEYVLSAMGTKPNIESLKLENTSIQLEDNFPVYDKNTLECIRTDDEPSNIFIAGDVMADREILHEAIWEGQHAGKNAASHLKVIDRKIRTQLSVTFTDPQVMMVGKTYKDLENSNEYTIGSVDFSNQGRSRIMLKNKGLLHVYATKENGQFIGAEMCGPAAEHLGHLLAWAIEKEMTIDEMLLMPFYHPVIEEGLRTALRNAKLNQTN